MTVPQRLFFPALHGLRGIAVLYVLVSHIGLNGLPLVPLPHDGVGKVGVWIFFSLSAFLLTTHLLHDLEWSDTKSGAVAQYAINRFFRIYPLYLAVLLAHLALGDMDAAGFFDHLVLRAGQEELWAISVEFQYYLAIPFIALAAFSLSLRRTVLLLSAALLAALWYGVNNATRVFSTELNLFAKAAPFLLGSMLAVGLAKRPAAAENEPASLLTSVVSMLCLVYLTSEYRHLMRESLFDFVDPWLSLALGLNVAWVIHLSLRAGPPWQTLHLAPLRVSREISFSVYLLHLFVIRAMAYIDVDIGLYAKAWLAFAVSLALAALSYRCIERPGIALGRRLGNRLAFRPRKAEVASLASGGDVGR